MSSRRNPVGHKCPQNHLCLKNARMTSGRHTAVVTDTVRPPNAALNDIKGLAAATHAMAVGHSVKGRKGRTAHAKDDVRNTNPDILLVFTKYPPFGLRRAPQNGACSPRPELGTKAGLHFRRVEGPVLSKVEGLILSKAYYTPRRNLGHNAL